MGALVHQAFAFLVGELGPGPRDHSRLRQPETSWQGVLDDAVERGLFREQGRSSDRGLDLDF